MGTRADWLSAGMTYSAEQLKDLGHWKMSSDDGYAVDIFSFDEAEDDGLFDKLLFAGERLAGVLAKEHGVSPPFTPVLSEMRTILSTGTDSAGRFIGHEFNLLSYYRFNLVIRDGQYALRVTSDLPVEQSPIDLGAAVEEALDPDNDLEPVSAN